MFDPERLLKQMLGGALGGALGGDRGRKKYKTRSGMGGGISGALGGLGTGQKAALGLGALGVAMAAWEHYKGQSTTAAQPASAAQPLPTMSPPPPPPPPPAPSAMMAPSAAPQGLVPEALLVIRSMIAAAAADGLIDGNEREAILGRAQDAGLHADDLAALRQELAQPLSMPELLAQTPAHLAAEVYAAALITISVDTEAERRWMQRLAEGLKLDDSQRAQLDAQFASLPQ